VLIYASARLDHQTGGGRCPGPGGLSSIPWAAPHPAMESFGKELLAKTSQAHLAELKKKRAEEQRSVLNKLAQKILGNLDLPDQIPKSYHMQLLTASVRVRSREVGQALCSMHSTMVEGHLGIKPDSGVFVDLSLYVDTEEKWWVTMNVQIDEAKTGRMDEQCRMLW